MLLRPKWASPAVLLSLMMVCWDWASDFLVGFVPGSSPTPTTTATPSSTGSLDSQSNSQTDTEASQRSTLPDHSHLGGGGVDDSTATSSGPPSEPRALDGHDSSSVTASASEDQRSEAGGRSSEEANSEADIGPLINDQALPSGEFCSPTAPHPYVDMVPEVQPPFHIVPSAPLPPPSAGWRPRGGLSHVPATSTRSLPGRVRSRVGPARSHPRLQLEDQVYRPVFGPSPAPSIGTIPQPRGTRTPSLVSVDLGSTNTLHAGVTPYGTPTGSQRSLATPARQALHPPSSLLADHNYPSLNELDVLGQQSSLTPSWASGLDTAAETLSTAATLASDLEAGWRAANTVSHVSIKTTVLCQFDEKFSCYFLFSGYRLVIPFHEMTDRTKNDDPAQPGHGQCLFAEHDLNFYIL